MAVFEDGEVVGELRGAQVGAVDGGLAVGAGKNGRGGVVVDFEVRKNAAVVRAVLRHRVQAHDELVGNLVAERAFQLGHQAVGPAVVPEALVAEVQDIGRAFQVIGRAGYEIVAQAQPVLVGEVVVEAHQKLVAVALDGGGPNRAGVVAVPALQAGAYLLGHCHGYNGPRVAGGKEHGLLAALVFVVGEVKKPVFEDGPADAHARLHVVVPRNGGAVGIHAPAGDGLVAGEAVDAARQPVGAAFGYGVDVGPREIAQRDVKRRNHHRNFVDGINRNGLRAGQRAGRARGHRPRRAAGRLLKPQHVVGGHAVDAQVVEAVVGAPEGVLVALRHQLGQVAQAAVQRGQVLDGLLADEVSLAVFVGRERVAFVARHRHFAQRGRSFH